MSNGERAWLHDEVVLMPPGVGLHAELAGADRDRLDDDDLVRLAQSQLRLISHLQAEFLASLQAIGRRGDGVLATDERSRRDWAEVEVAAAMTWTGRAASWQLELPAELVDRLPGVYAALHQGVIDLPKARVCCDATLGLDTPIARRIVDQVLGEAHKLTTGQLRARLQRLVFAAAPELKKHRARQAVTDRRVWARLNDDGLGDLFAHDLPPQRVAAAMERLNALARSAKSDGDRRKTDQLRADILLDLLVGEGIAVGAPITGATFGVPDDPPPAHDRPPTPPSPGPTLGVPDDHTNDADDAGDLDHEEVAPLWAAGFDQLPTTRPVPARCCPHCRNALPAGALPAPRRGVVELQVPLETLIGLADFPGELAGFGPVIADIARQVVAEQSDATWRFSVYDPLGQLIHHGITRRRPSARDTAFIKARDHTCRFPGCRAPARHCDIDHSQDWQHTKDSRPCNLACLCRKHHLYKHLETTSLLQLTPGVLGWTTRLGQRYVTHPEPYLYSGQ